MGESSMDEEPIPVFGETPSPDIPEEDISDDPVTSLSMGVPDGKKNASVSFQIPLEDHELLVSRAMGARMKVSQYLRELIRAEGRKSRPFYPYIPPENLKVYQMIEGVVLWMGHLNETLKNEVIVSDKAALWATIDKLRDSYNDLRRELLGLEPGQPLRNESGDPDQKGEAFFVSEEESWEKTEVDPADMPEGIPSVQNGGE